MSDYYKILGVERGASPDAIKRAYRQKASLYHPDKEGGSKVKFQEVEQAYRTLSDPQLRQQYDNPQPSFGGFGGFQHNHAFDIDAIFQMFGQRPQHNRRAQMTLWITLEDVARGGPRTISVGTQQGTHTVEIEVPQGINDGDSIQYGGIGPGGMDLIITFRIHPNPKWQRQDLNLITEATIDIWDLILGSELRVTDVMNNVITVAVPAGTQPGSMLRLRGRGLVHRQRQPGDILVRVQTRIPENISPELLESIKKNRAG